MAGRLSYTVGVTGSGAIPVKRLMAKVTAELTCSWTGTISSVKVYNLNGTLKPFGESVATSAGDILPVQEFQTGTGASSGTFVFYVPENLQGTISGISASSDKSPEGSTEVDARKDVLTYLEAEVEGTDGVTGTILYRSFLGNNATSDFDIHRNWRYTWTIDYLPDGRLNNDWKHENGLTWSEYRYTISPTSLSLYKGESGTINVWRHEDKYISGTFYADAGASLQYSSHFNWSYTSGGILGVLSGNSYTVAATGSGTSRVTATGPDGTGAQSLYCDVTALGYKRQLLLLASPAPRAAVGQNIYLKARVYSTNSSGITQFEKDVTGEEFYCHIYRMGYEGSNPVVVTSQGVLTAYSPGQERFSATYNYAADSKTLGANGLYVRFENQLTGNLSITEFEASASKSGSVQLHAQFTPYVGGSPSTPTDVTNAVQWNIQDGGNYFYVSNTGLVTSSVSGATVVQATYSINGLTYEAQTVVLFHE